MRKYDTVLPFKDDSIVRSCIPLHLSWMEIHNLKFQTAVWNINLKTGVHVVFELVTIVKTRVGQGNIIESLEIELLSQWPSVWVSLWDNHNKFTKTVILMQCALETSFWSQTYRLLF